MPTPNLYDETGKDPFPELSPSLKSTEVRLFYVTDRGAEKDEETGALHYGYQRSPSIGFGTAVIDLAYGMTWEELNQASRTNTRAEPVELKIREINELGRTPETPLPFALVDGEIVHEPESVAKLEQAVARFHESLSRQLALTSRKEVFLYVHGYNNTFEDSAFGMAELWHFMGRIGVPVIYTWPSDYPGLFGYTNSRESSEFTVYHLRRVLVMLATHPELERIHLIAHSRGTDVAVAALRELTIAVRAAGNDPRETLKIHNLVLAAADLDLQVFMQRIMGDKLPLTPYRFTIYSSPQDEALGFASRLFQSPRGRLGKLTAEDAPDGVKQAMEYGHANVAVINFPGEPGSSGLRADQFGHSYFRNNPEVSSDLILMLRDDLDPGPPGRPLEHLGYKFWRVPSNYPLPSADRTASTPKGDER
jgi:esterase/lipase superfamily enzyme